MDIEKIRNAVKKGNVEWKGHSFEKMLERSISRSDVFEVILNGEIIEVYESDEPLPSALIFGWTEKKPLHVVAALNENADICHIITVYHPDDKHFEHDYKTRK